MNEEEYQHYIQCSEEENCVLEKQYRKEHPWEYW